MAPPSEPTLRARRAAEELRRRAEAITARLLYSDEPRVDLDIAIQGLRDFVEDRLPDRVWLFDCIYEARWQRLREQGWEHERPEW
jgi:hypothetical protein